MWKKISKAVYKISDVLEIIMAVVVAVAVVISIVMMIPEMKMLWQDQSGTQVLTDFLGQVFNIVIAIEFMKMLCKPTSDTIIEVLIFLVARHMIIGTTTAVGDLLSIISIAILFMIQYYMKNGPHKSMKVPEAEKKETEGFS